MPTDTTFLFAQTVISNGQYTGNQWTNSQYLLSNSGNYASTSSVSLLGADVVIGNFLFNIPTDSIIIGIEVSLTGYRDNSASPASVLDIYAFDNTTGGTFFYQLLPQFSGFSTSPVTYYFGSPTYLFNTTWTVDQINNLKLRLQANDLIYVSGVQVRVTYQAPSSGSSPTQDVCGSLFQSQPFTLIQPVSTNALDTAWLVDRFQTADGTDITNADITAPGIPITTDQGNQNEENQYVTAVTNTAGNQRILTVTRGWSFRDPVVQDPTLLRQHSAGAEIVISNSVPFYDVFLRKCHIGSLVSAPIETYDEGSLVTSYTRSYNFTGAGVFATGAVNPTGGKDVTVTIPGFSTSPATVTNSGSGTSGGTTVTTITDAGVVSTGTDRLLYVAVSLQSTETVTGITFNGDALTLRASRNEGDVRVEVWTLTAPDLGTHNLVINTSGLTYICWEWVNFGGVDQTTPWTAGSTNGGGTNTSTGSATTVTDNAVVMHALATKLVGITYTAGGGESILASSLSGAVQGAAQSQQVGTAATVTSNIDLSTNTDWANVLSSINGITPPAPIISPIEVQDEGVTIDPNTTLLNFVGAGVTVTSTGVGSVDIDVPTQTGDHKVAVTGADTTPNYLGSKLTAGTGITLTVLNPGANEEIEISAGSATSSFTVNADVTENTYFTSQIDAPRQITTGLGWTLSIAGGAVYPNGTHFGANGGFTAITTNGFLSQDTFQGPLKWGDTKIIQMKWFALGDVGTGTSGSGIYQGMGFSGQAIGAGWADITNTTDKRVGFGFYNGNLYSIVCDGSAITANILQAYAAVEKITYGIVWNPGTSVEFYLNGTLVDTITTNLPTGSGGTDVVKISLGGTNTGGGGTSIYSSHFIVSIEI